MPKRKLRFKIDFKPIINYILTILVTTIGIASILIALPLTESYLNNIAYNLTAKDNTYWAKQYVLELESNNEQDAEKTRDILFRRLNKFGVEDISTYKEYTKDSKKIRIDLQTSKDQEIVEELIKNPFQVQIVTRKDDVDFDDEENPYAHILSTNYNSTEWEREDFRTVYITKLTDSKGELSNFAIFKTWLRTDAKFKAFLKEYEGQYIGVNIDGFVTPYFVQPGNSNLLAVQMSTSEKDQVHAIELLYNSGVVPTSYSISSEKELTTNLPETNYIALFIGIIIAVLVTYGYLFTTKNSTNQTLIKSLLGTVIATSFYISMLKILSIPIDTFILALDVIFIAIFARVLGDNKDSKLYLEGLLIIIAFTIMSLGVGYQKIFAQEILLLTILTKITVIGSGWYINMVKNILKK